LAKDAAWSVTIVVTAVAVAVAADDDDDKRKVRIACTGPHDKKGLSGCQFCKGK